MVRTLHDDWSIKLGENIPEQSSITVLSLHALVSKMPYWSYMMSLVYSVCIFTKL